MGRGLTGAAGQGSGARPRSISRSQAVRPGSYEWPELRVARQAVWKGADNDELDWFLKTCASQNRRRGSTRILSEVACTLISDVEMRGMILDKFPNARDDLKKATTLYRVIGRGIRQYIAEADRDVRAYDQLVLDGERFGGPTGISGPDESSLMWLRTKFGITGPGVFGKNRLGFDLGGNQELWAEREAVIDYLRTEEKFNTRAFVDEEWGPHATYFDARPELNVNNIVMKYTVEAPNSIVLGATSAYTDG